MGARLRRKGAALVVNVLLTIIVATIVLGFLVFIHEGGHYLAARAFGVRVSEFMLGLPGPGVGFTHGETRFGATIVPLGGYARVCGMEPGPIDPNLKPVMGSLFRRGTAAVEDVCADTGLAFEEAEDALEVLVEWGCAIRPRRRDALQAYRTTAVNPTKRQVRRARREGVPLLPASGEGEPRMFPAGELDAVYDAEFRRQYRSLPFWKRCVIVAAGPVVNILFAMLAFVVIYSVIGFDVQNTATGEVTHMTVGPLRAVYAGFMYLGAVVQAVLGLFNPAQVAEVVEGSASIVGIAVIAKAAADAGLVSLLEFTAMISVSLGVMNLVPIMPLDGGRLLVEVVQRVLRRPASARALGAFTVFGTALFLLLFVVMLNQDITRFIL